VTPTTPAQAQAPRAATPSPDATAPDAQAPGGHLPDLRYSEQEAELRAVVRELLDDRAPWPAVLARLETSEPTDTALWRTLAADLGCAGLLIPESHGGAGASYREAAVVAEETGRAVAPVPYLGSAVMATTALLATGGPLLDDLATGRVTAALAVEFSRMPPPRPWGEKLASGARVSPPRPGTSPGRPAWPGP
jgi:hypothetical protein